jgi:hypothetical protein
MYNYLYQGVFVMENKPASGHRIHFSRTVAQTPVRLVGSDGRYGVFIFHNSSADLRIGNSGSIATEGLLVPSSQKVFADFESVDEWWAYYASGSGTVSGYSVV